MAISPISVNKVGQYVMKSKKPIKSGFVEFGKQYGIIYVPSFIFDLGIITTNPILTAIGVTGGLGAIFYNFGRTINRWGKGLFFKFENKLGQEGLEKLSKIDFSKLQGINLNKLAKGKVAATSKEADEFVKVAQGLIAQKRKINFNVLHDVDIFKLSK